MRFASTLTTLADPRAPAAEAVGALRSHLVARHLRDGHRSLAFCAATEGVGCSWLAANTAVATAQGGVRTLLIDANLREPGLDRLVDTGPDRPGLSDVLTGSATLRDAVVRDALPGLSVLHAGRSTDNPQELLASPEFRELIAECLRDHDLTIVDTPPASRSADARRVASILRYALIVVRRSESFVADAKRLREELEADRATVIGAFLNDY